MSRLRHFDVSWLGYVGLVGLPGFLFGPLTRLRLACLFFLFFLLPLFKPLISVLRGTPARGQAIPLIRYYSSVLLALLNPFFLWQSSRQAFGQLWILMRTYAAHTESYQHTTVLSLPLEGWWTVARGGIDRRTSHSWDLLNQRYAYDFYVLDHAGRSHQGAGRWLADYYAFDQPVLAPADGLVVRVRDGARDAPRPGSGWLEWRARDMRGNYVVIDHGGGEFSLLAHLRRGSIMVQRGAHVRRGQILGRCGNSGLSTEPHLHVQLQDRPDFFNARSLPITFRTFAVRTAGHDQTIEAGVVSAGQTVAARSEATLGAQKHRGDERRGASLSS